MFRFDLVGAAGAACSVDDDGLSLLDSEAVGCSIDVLCDRVACSGESLVVFVDWLGGSSVALLCDRVACSTVVACAVFDG